MVTYKVDTAFFKEGKEKNASNDRPLAKVTREYYKGETFQWRDTIIIRPPNIETDLQERRDKQNRDISYQNLVKENMDYIKEFDLYAPLMIGINKEKIRNIWKNNQGRDIEKKEMLILYQAENNGQKGDWIFIGQVGFNDHNDGEVFVWRGKSSYLFPLMGGRERLKGVVAEATIGFLYYQFATNPKLSAVFAETYARNEKAIQSLNNIGLNVFKGYGKRYGHKTCFYELKRDVFYKKYGQPVVQEHSIPPNISSQTHKKNEKVIQSLQNTEVDVSQGAGQDDNHKVSTPESMEDGKPASLKNVPEEKKDPIDHSSSFPVKMVFTSCVFLVMGLALYFVVTQKKAAAKRRKKEVFL
ncbi:MAG: GNAT family protein [Bacteroidota bacterium]